VLVKEARTICQCIRPSSGSDRAVVNRTGAILPGLTLAIIGSNMFHSRDHWFLLNYAILTTKDTDTHAADVAKPLLD